MQVQDVGPGLPEPAAEAGQREGVAVREAERVIGDAGRGHSVGGTGELVTSKGPHGHRDVRSSHDGEVLDDALLAAEAHVVDDVQDLHGVSAPTTATRTPPSACERLSASMIWRDWRASSPVTSGAPWPRIAATMRANTSAWPWGSPASR